MHTAAQYEIAESFDIGSTRIPHLKRLWGKLMSGSINAKVYQGESEIDTAILNITGLGLLPTYQFIYEHKPTLAAFEKWVLTHYPDGVPHSIISQCNQLLAFASDTASNCIESVLTSEELSYWDEHGYVIIRNAVAKEDCKAAIEAICEYLKIEEYNPDTWYSSNADKLQGIMVPLYNHPAIEKNRLSHRIRQAYVQLWKQQQLIVTTDKCGFNPPETAQSKYRGIGLHWDVSLATPIPFGTQGILYLTDTAANQGALTLVPGFHKKLEGWLQSLPPDENPRSVDLSNLNPQPISANTGDFIIWNHQLPHSSSPNTAKSPRIVQYINWYSPTQPVQEQWL
jgi:hypothetical protein